MKKYLIFDSGALINFASNSLLSVLEKLKQDFNGDFLITNQIKYETIDYPLKIKRFEWGAIRIKDLLKNDIIKLAEKRIVNGTEMNRNAEKMMSKANNTFFADGEALNILDKGESQVLALSKMLSEKKLDNVIVIDERTARVLCENPENLQKILNKKLHREIIADKKMFKEFKGFKIIRSTELAYIAYQKGFIRKIDPKTLEAVIYALKFGGVSISEKEAESYKDMK